MEIDEKIQYAIQHTEVVRPPRQSLATFGTTNIYYYLITELMDQASVVREGRVIAAKPKIITPSYLIHLEGFSEQARRFFEMMAEESPYEAGIYYSYRNEAKEMNVVSSPMDQIVDRLNEQIDHKKESLSAIIRGVEESWDVSLLKFTYELTRRSVNRNVAEFHNSNLLAMDSAGIPQDARNTIEELFEKTRQNNAYASELVSELRRWGLFAEYQDRFLSLFRER
jgi:hypothetical protein